MALSVAPVNNPSLVPAAPAPTVSGVISATPGSNGFAGLPQPPVTPTQQQNNQTSPSGTSTTSATSAATAAALAKAEANYHNGMAADMNTINSGIDTGSKDYNASILDAFNNSGGFKSQQNAVNDEQTQNELSRLQGMQGVRDMVNNGIQGGGVVLDNAGAGTSSAGDALARAYGIQGRQQASRVGEQAAQGENTIQTHQNDLSTAEDNFMNVDAPKNKADIINGIVASATQALTYLNAQAASASLPDQMNIAQQIADVKAQATAALSQFDGSIQASRGANTPLPADQYQSKAAQLFQAGTAPAKSFDFTSQAPAQLQNNGPVASNLPIFTSSVANKNDNGIPT